MQKVLPRTPFQKPLNKGSACANMAYGAGNWDLWGCLHLPVRTFCPALSKAGGCGQRPRKNGIFFLITFSFVPLWSKEKVAMAFAHTTRLPHSLNWDLSVSLTMSQQD